MIPQTPIREALADPLLLGHVIADDSWRVWRILLIAAMGEALTDDERIIFKQFTGREHEPMQRVNELAVVAGRRGGKTRAMAVLASYLATLCDHSDALARGETGVLLCIAQDQRIATKILDFCEADIQNSDILRGLFRSRRNDTIELTTNINIEVRPASFRKLRGPTYIGVIADELAFWYTDSEYANPDVEILAAIRPGLLTTRGPLIMASSPYAKQGVLWDTYRKHYGPDGAPTVLVAKGTTREFNSTIPQSEINRELERDRARNTAELLAEFRSDLESFVSLEVVEACVGSYYEIAPARATSYHAFVDAAGGSGKDAFAMAIGHKEGNNIIIDCVREKRPPFQPGAVIEEFEPLLRMYRIHKVVGDRWAGGFPPEAFQRCGVRYEPAKKVKSELYVDLLPLLNSGRITLPRNERLVAQIVSLERTVTRGSGKENIDHPRDMHDDVSTAVAGAASLALTHGNYWDAMRKAFSLDDDEDDAEKPPRLKLIGNHWEKA
jgi:hypothetical protein